jgi:hypothetical protein
LPEIPHFASKKTIFAALSTQNKIKQKSSQTAAFVKEKSIQKTKTAGLLGNRQYD